MVRTQIQLTQQQARSVKQAAAAAHLSMADIIRRGLDLYLRPQGTLTTENRIQRARAAAGRFRSGRKDMSARHDAHLAEAFKGLSGVLGARRTKLSVVDGVSFAVMRRLGLRDVFTFDTHFKEQDFACHPQREAY